MTKEQQLLQIAKNKLDSFYNVSKFLETRDWSYEEYTNSYITNLTKYEYELIKEWINN